MIQEAGNGLVVDLNLLVNVLGIVIATLTFLDILLNKNRRNFGLDQKTNWFYNNEKYERELDSRADKNQYKL